MIELISAVIGMAIGAMSVGLALFAMFRNTYERLTKLESAAPFNATSLLEPRVRLLESQVAVLSNKMEATTHQLERIDGKIDRILSELSERG